VETIKRQTKAVYGCMVAGQSPWVRAWTAYRLYARSVCNTKVQLQLQYADCSATYMLYAFAYLSQYTQEQLPSNWTMKNLGAGVGVSASDSWFAVTGGDIAASSIVTQ